jgi:hypothetical protein
VEGEVDLSLLLAVAHDWELLALAGGGELGMEGDGDGAELAVGKEGLFIEDF